MTWFCGFWCGNLKNVVEIIIWEMVDCWGNWKERDSPKVLFKASMMMITNSISTKYQIMYQVCSWVVFNQIIFVTTNDNISFSDVCVYATSKLFLSPHYFTQRTNSYIEWDAFTIGPYCRNARCLMILTKAQRLGFI